MTGRLKSSCFGVIAKYDVQTFKENPMKIEYIPVALAALASAVALALDPSQASLLRLGWIWGVGSLSVLVLTKADKRIS
jgi:hypothetical protein